MPSETQARITINRLLAERRRLVAEFPRLEAKIQRVLDRVWGNGAE